MITEKCFFLRYDIFFGGDSAACPFSSLKAKTLNNYSNEFLPANVCDVGGWMDAADCDESDWVLVRLIEPGSSEAEKVYNSCPQPFKSIDLCAAADLDLPTKFSCVCEKFFNNTVMQSCLNGHASRWHRFPQSGMF
jgi:hypothetical protein